jgi:hypothetical protein
VRVGAQEELTGSSEAALGDHLMADAVVADVEELAEPELLGELPCEVVTVCVARGRSGCSVVEDDGEPLRVRDPQRLAPRHGRRGELHVEHDGPIDLADDDVAGGRALAPRAASQDLFGHRQSHRRKARGWLLAGPIGLVAIGAAERVRKRSVAR